MKKIISFQLIFFTLLTGAFAQGNPDSLVVKLDSLNNSLNIVKNTLIFIDSVDHFPVEKIPASKFILLTDLKFKKTIPARLITSPVFLQFTLQNVSPKSQQYYFFPGMYYDKIGLYKRTAFEGLKKVDFPETKAGFVFLKVPPGNITTYVVALKFSKLDYNRVTATLVNPDFLPNFILGLSKSYAQAIASYILCGILLLMILFALTNFFLSKKIEFIYYSFYALSMFFLIFFTAYFTRRPGRFTAFIMSYLDLMLLIAGTIFYLAFIRKFLNTKKNHLLLDKLFKAEAWVLTALMFVYSFLHFESTEIFLGNIIENSMKILALLVGMIFIYMGLRQKDRLMRYIAMGSAAQIFFSVISLLLIFYGKPAATIFTSAFFYFEVGIIMAISFFLLGLTYKNRRELIERTQEQEAMKLEVEKKVFETKLAVVKAQQEERNRISADMHDDLGAGMTTIRLFSELAKTKMGDMVIPEIEKISASANELLNKMNAIIWSMSSSNDTLGNMVAYIRSYSQEYFENTGIDCRITIPESLPELEVSGIIRRNVFLVVKEALNNIVKHSGATEVKISLQKEGKGLSLIIQDNGKGIDNQKLSQFGNGLRNMKKRMDDVGIEFSIEHINGTVVRLYREILN